MNAAKQGHYAFKTDCRWLGLLPVNGRLRRG